MASKSILKGKGKATAKAKMLTSVINRHLSSDRDRINRFILKHIRGLIRIFIVCSVNVERARDLFYDIIFLDPVMTCHFSQFQLMWPHRRSRSSRYLEWWAAFRSCMGQMFDKTPRSNSQLEVRQPPCLRGSSRSLLSADSQLGNG